MHYIPAGIASLVLIFTAQVQAREVFCPAVNQIQRNIEAVEDVFFVETQNGLEWQSESLVDVVNPTSLRFSGAEYVIHPTDEPGQASARTTLTCKYGEINLAVDYPQALEPRFSNWVNLQCDSPDPRACKLISADYFNLSFEH